MNFFTFKNSWKDKMNKITILYKNRIHIMASFFHQLKLLLWKNFLLRKRHKLRLIMEIIWPLFLFLVLMWVRTSVDKYSVTNCHLGEKTLPSVSGFEFLQNFMCSLNNTCYDSDTYVEDKGYNLWNNAIVVKLVKDTQPILTQILSDPKSLKAFRSISEAFIPLINIFSNLQIKNELEFIKMGDLMSNDGQKKFRNTLIKFTNLENSDVEDLLEAQIELSNLDFSQRTNFRNRICGEGSSNFLVLKDKKKEESLKKKLCNLEKSEILLMFHFFGIYMKNEGLALRIKNTITPENQNISSSVFENLKDIDNSTIYNFLDLFKKFSESYDAVMRSGLYMIDGNQSFAFPFYESVCGIKINNSETFGFDPGTKTHVENLKDNLKGWKRNDEYKYDPTISKTCNYIFAILEESLFTSILWRQIKPFIRGQIFYSPVNNFTEDIMSRVEVKFEKLKGLEHGFNRFLDILHQVRVWLKNNTVNIELIKEVLSNEESVNLLFSSLGFSPESNKEAIDGLVNFIKNFDIVMINVFLYELDNKNAEMYSEILSCIKYDNKTFGFETEEEAVEAAMNLTSFNVIWAVVVFPEESENSTGNSHVKYKIRMDADKVDNTRMIRDRLTSKGPRRRPAFDIKYFSSGFIYLQELIEHSIIEYFTSEELTESIYMQQFPYPCYIEDPFIRAIARTFPLFMVLSWVYASAMIIKSIVLEKETRMREMMKVMGVTNNVIWVGWFIDSFIVMSLSSLVLSLILKYGNVVEFSDFGLIFFFMISFTVATIMFSFLVSTFFEKANSAAAAGGILFFVTYLPYTCMIIWEERLEWHNILMGCLLSNVAFGFGCNYFARFEQDGLGAQWDRISLKTMPGDDFNLSYCIMMLWIDSFIYGLLTWYIEKVFPGTNRVSQKWYFPLSKSYWIQEIPLKKKDSLYENIPNIDTDLEIDPEGLIKGIVIENLSKTYPNGQKALSNLSITFYEGQITAFLGHNGSGKTTTLNILTGLISPTKGKVRISNLDLATQIDLIRKDIGYCPQQNVLFDKLNVIEHLLFFSALKKNKGLTKDEIENMLELLGIPQKKFSYPNSLSGGMQRKLSIAIAFIGRSKTVIIDEATSGVDPYSRRSIWDLLLKFKENRTILLSTHYMDEAEILGDRIAIISKGKLKTIGTALYLKSHFGKGYSLRLVRNELLLQSDNSQQSSNETNKQIRSNICSKQAKELNNFIQSIIPQAVLFDCAGHELAFLLPYTSLNSFPKLFTTLDANLENLKISSYGISDTTLEDIFLKLTVDDLEENPESFNSLHFTSKRKLMNILKFKKLKRAQKNKISNLNESEPNNLSLISVKNNLQENGIFNLENGSNHSLNNISKIKDAGHFDSLSSERKENGFIKKEDPERLNNGNLDTETTYNFSRDEEDESLELPKLNKLESRQKICCLCLVQIWAMILKRIHNSKRNKKALFLEIILPVVFIAITLALTLIVPRAINEPPLEISAWQYKSPFYTFLAETESTEFDKVVYEPVIDELLGSTGMGSVCVKDSYNKTGCDPSSWSIEKVDAFQKSRNEFGRGILSDCSCSRKFMHCSQPIEKTRPPRTTLVSEDVLLDLSNFNISEWTRKTYWEYQTKIYGGFEFKNKEIHPVNLTEYAILIHHLISLSPLHPADPDDDFNNTPTKYTKKIWYENRAWISSIAYLNALNNMILRSKLDPSLSKEEFGITLYSHPLNLTEYQQNRGALRSTFLGVVHAICIIFALSFIPASFTVYLIDERVSGAKHLHLISGVKPITYWLGNFIYDMLKYIIPIILVVLLFYLFDARSYIDKNFILPFILLLILFGWASIPLMYPGSYIFNVSSTAFVVLACTNLFIGVITTVTTFVLEQFDDEKLKQTSNLLQVLFLVFPHYCLGRGLVLLVTYDFKRQALFEIFEGGFKNQEANSLWTYFGYEYLGKLHICMFVQGLLFFSLNVLNEYTQILNIIYKYICSLFSLIFRKNNEMMQSDEEQDIDVVKERQRILDSQAIDASIIAINLTKKYRGKKRPAVNKLCFGIEPGECFGLLGINGAGKTTCFKLLTGDLKITSGSAKIVGYDLEKHLDKCRKHFSYCPQQDALDPLLNSYEHLSLYGRLRGISKSETINNAKKLIKSLGLTHHAKQMSCNYSGGNKRKLSLAIALIGDPDVIFLDEMSTGMDPGSRRQVWKVIIDLVRSGKSVLLTSHSMEECEALVSRLAIMVNGKFMCIGSLQHIKNRFGTGYTLTIRFVKEAKEEFLTRIKSDLPLAKLEDEHCSQMKFSISQENAKLSQLFELLYAAKTDGLIVDYSITQTTLDDIFVKFASQQNDDKDR